MLLALVATKRSSSGTHSRSDGEARAEQAMESEGSAFQSQPHCYLAWPPQVRDFTLSLFPHLENGSNVFLMGIKEKEGTHAS